MAKFETYRAVANEAAARERKARAPFSITIRFLGGLTEPQKTAFKKAANRWSRVIVGDVPGVVVDGERIDDVLISAEGGQIDGNGGILGQAGPTHVRPRNAGRAAFIPAKGQMQFDSADLSRMEQAGTLEDVITHEMGHVLGIGTIWGLKGLLNVNPGTNPTFTGAGAMREYATLRGGGNPQPVPVENTGGPGTANSHWRETVFRNELMSGFISGPSNPISRVTVASLEDMGYLVDLNAAEAYQLPNLLEAAERGLLLKHASAPHQEGVVFPIIPSVLPEDSMAP